MIVNRLIILFLMLLATGTTSAQNTDYIDSSINSLYAFLEDALITDLASKPKPFKLHLAIQTTIGNNTLLVETKQQPASLFRRKFNQLIDRFRNPTRAADLDLDRVSVRITFAQGFAEVTEQTRFMLRADTFEFLQRRNLQASLIEVSLLPSSLIGQPERLFYITTESASPALLLIANNLLVVVLIILVAASLLLGRRWIRSRPKPPATESATIEATPLKRSKKPLEANQATQLASDPTQQAQDPNPQSISSLAEALNSGTAQQTSNQPEITNQQHSATIDSNLYTDTIETSDYQTTHFEEAELAHKIQHTSKMIYQELFKGIMKSATFISQLDNHWYTLNHYANPQQKPFYLAKRAVLYSILGKQVLMNGLSHINQRDVIDIAIAATEIDADLDYKLELHQAVIEDLETLNQQSSNSDPYQHPFGFLLSINDALIISLLRNMKRHIQAITLAQFDYDRSEALAIALFEADLIDDIRSEVAYYRKIESHYFQDVASYLATASVQLLIPQLVTPSTDFKVEKPSPSFDSQRAFDDQLRQQNLILTSTNQQPLSAQTPSAEVDSEQTQAVPNFPSTAVPFTPLDTHPINHQQEPDLTDPANQAAAPQQPNHPFNSQHQQPSKPTKLDLSQAASNESISPPQAVDKLSLPPQAKPPNPSNKLVLNKSHQSHQNDGLKNHSWFDYNAKDSD